MVAGGGACDDGGMTRIRGVDFTSVPRRGKPITLAEAQLDGEVLRVDEVLPLASFIEFEDALAEEGPWVAAIDFPFGLPLRFLDNVEWPRSSWIDYVEHVRSMGKVQFEDSLAEYMAPRGEGDKEHKRRTDPPGAASPMKLGRPAVAKMFFEGAPRIARAGANVLPCAPRDSDRVIVEGYAVPVVQALVAQKRFGYKGKGSERRQRREQIVSDLTGRRCRRTYGVAVTLSPADEERLIEDQEGDLLDAVLCAVQAAWVSSQLANGGLAQTDSVLRLEGRIADPSIG